MFGSPLQSPQRPSRKRSEATPVKVGARPRHAKRHADPAPETPAKRRAPATPPTVSRDEIPAPSARGPGAGVASPPATRGAPSVSRRLHVPSPPRPQRARRSRQVLFPSSPPSAVPATAAADAAAGADTGVVDAPDAARAAGGRRPVRVHSCATGRAGTVVTLPGDCTWARCLQELRRQALAPAGGAAVAWSHSARGPRRAVSPCQRWAQCPDPLYLWPSKGVESAGERRAGGGEARGEEAGGEGEPRSGEATAAETAGAGGTVEKGEAQVVAEFVIVRAGGRVDREGVALRGGWSWADAVDHLRRRGYLLHAQGLPLWARHLAEAPQTGQPFKAAGQAPESLVVYDVAA